MGHARRLRSRTQYLLVRDSKLRKHWRCRRAFHGIWAGALHHVVSKSSVKGQSRWAVYLMHTKFGQIPRCCWDIFAIWFLLDFIAPQLNSSVSDMMAHDFPWSPQLQASLVESKLQLQDFLGAREGFWWPPSASLFLQKWQQMSGKLNQRQNYFTLDVANGWKSEHHEPMFLNKRRWKSKDHHAFAQCNLFVSFSHDPTAHEDLRATLISIAM